MCYNQRRMKDTFTQLVRLGVMIAALALVLYWVDSAYFAPRRLPACVQEELPEGRVCLETLRAKWQGKVVWVDARSESDYEVNHLMFKDNRMFPIRRGAQKEALIDAAIERLIAAQDNGECIVVFCTNECTASTEIAEELRNLGPIEAPVYVLQGGWAALEEGGMVNFR